MNVPSKYRHAMRARASPRWRPAVVLDSCWTLSGNKIARGLVGKGREETGNKKQEKRARGAEEIDILDRRAESRSMVNAMRTSNHKKQLVKSSCGLLIDPC